MNVIQAIDYELDLMAGPSPFTGNTPLKVTNSNLRYNKEFIKDAIQWATEWANERYIDISKYSYLSVSRNYECVWQVDFYQTEELDGPHISLYGAYLSKNNRKILQAAIALE